MFLFSVHFAQLCFILFHFRWKRPWEQVLFSFFLSLCCFAFFSSCRHFHSAIVVGVAAVVDIHFIFYIFTGFIHLLLLANTHIDDTIREITHIIWYSEELRTENRVQRQTFGSNESVANNNQQPTRGRERDNESTMNQNQCQIWSAKEIARVVCIGKLVLNKYQIICPKEG